VNKPELTHRNTIVQPGFLDVGIAVETYIEDRETYFCLSSRTVTWMGFSEDMKLFSEKAYLKDTIDGLNQVVVIEFETREAALSVSEDWHNVSCALAEAQKRKIKEATLYTHAMNIR